MQEEEEGRRRKKGERKRGKSQQTLSTSEILVVDNNWEEASVDDPTSPTSCKLQNLDPLCNLHKYGWVGTLY